MSKLLKSMAVGVIALGTILVSPVASAEMVCEIGYTGPDSENRCITTTRYICTVENDTDIVIKDTNDQDAVSGTATLEDNGEGGTATSGSVTNTNGTTFDFVIENPGYESVCVVTASVPATEEPETPEVPVTPVTPVQPTVSGGGAVTQLPVTEGDTSGPMLVALAGAVGGLALLSAIASILYGRRTNR